MNTESAIDESVEQAADSVGSVWPLHSFVTANPLAGFEDHPFHEAVERAEDLLGGDGYPSPHVFRRAWETGRIDPDLLAEKLDAHGYTDDPEASLDRMEADADQTPDPKTAETPADRVDAVLTKWLAAFLDQGTATWSMPDREQGFYAAFRSVAPHDGDIPDESADDTWPAEPDEAIERVLDEHPRDEWPAVFEHHLAALPGWAGYIKQRATDGGEWQSTYPITLVEFLAVRLTLADLFDAPIAPPETGTDDDHVTDDDAVPLEAVWLSAWEASYRSELVEAVSDASPSVEESEEGRPDAQFVFCIDTRSEIIRRHVEAAGDYETHGYAGFFGIPMRYEGYDADVSVDACPPIVDAEHRITDRPTEDADQQSYDRWSNVRDAGGKLIKSLRSNAATAFSYVESAGAGYGLALAGRTLLPGRVYDAHDAADERVPADHEVCEPSVDYNPDAVTELREGLTLDEKVEYAAAAFETMGWEEFARVVVFAGHASQTANNPFDSSLDCGACAGNPGGPNARVLATICNDEDVRAELRERGIEIPEDTVFVAGEHNTTTDEIDLFDGSVPESHAEDIEQLRADLETARAGAAAERTESLGAADDAGVRNAERRAADWAETRPEWGLAGNAGFVVGPRDLTENLDLDGRSFLHSYDWRTDDDGDALEAIVTGPLVVTQWINTQYYFATVDTGVFGSGSKVTHNPVGNVGVYQGNGGDLLTGLPLQSLKAAADDPYHQPLRLSTVIHAPVERVTEVLADHEDVTELLDNGWLSLTVVDPEQDQQVFHYDGELTWTGHEEAEAPTVTQSPTAEPSAEATADD